MYLFAEVGQENLIGSLLDFHSNFINWLILVLILFFVIRKAIPPIISQRQLSINNELAAAAMTRQSAERALAQQKQQIEQASQAAEKIVFEAQQTALQMVQEIHRQTEQDKNDLLKKFELAVHNERQAAVLEMRNIVARAAIKLTEENLPNILNENSKTKIGHEFMGELSHFNQANMDSEPVKKNSREGRDLGKSENKESFQGSPEEISRPVNDKNLVDS
jgi:F-type H+-transporting ATPase subunit b